MLDREYDLLRESEEKYRLFFENAPLGYQSLDQDGRLLDVNQTWLDLMGYDKDDVLGHMISDFLSPVSIEQFPKYFPLFKRTGRIQNLEFELIRADGTVMIVAYDGRVAYSSDGVFLRTHCMFRDITAARESERALLVSEERLQALADASFEAIFLSDKGTCIDQNLTAERMFGYTHAEAIGRPGTDWIAPEDRDLVKKNMMAGSEVPYEATALRKDGSTFAAELQARMFKYGNRDIRVTAVRDISARKRIELEAQAGQQRFRTLFENAGDYMLLLDPTIDDDPIITDANRSICEAHGCVREDLVGQPLQNLLTDETQMLTDERVCLIKDGQTLTFEATHRIGDGKTMTVEVTATLVDHHGQPRILSIGRDISRRRAQEKEMLQTEKMESVGLLAGGIAHDFNNLLGGILGNISMAKQDIDENSEAYDMLGDAEKAATRAASLTKRLLTFSKGGAPVRARTAIHEVVRESAEFSVSGANVKCLFSLKDDLHPVHIDRDLIGQVIQNLVINAKQAMPSGGTIVLEGRNVQAGPDGPLPLATGDYLSLSVTDTGEGIPPDVRSRIFDPFYTTKPEGSGLGLTTCYSIIRQHDGFIDVHSETGKGTTFCLYLPADTGPGGTEREEAGDEPADRSTGERAKGHLLVMDDEQMVLDLEARMLRQCGYTVDCVLNAEDAIARYRDSLDGAAQAYAGVILDLTIRGGRGGLEVIKSLRELTPDVKALVCSGYSDDPVMADCASYGFGGALLKPFEPEQLRMALAQLLDA
jgi:PAS domain S-box-containing protein